MTTLGITKRAVDGYAIFGGVDMVMLSPDAAMQRVEDGMSWLLGQPSPHEIVLDDPSGIAVMLITAWVMTNSYACCVTFRRPDGVPIGQAGIWDNGYAYVNAFNTEPKRAIQKTHAPAPYRHAPTFGPAEPPRPKRQ